MGKKRQEEINMVIGWFKTAWSLDCSLNINTSVFTVLGHGEKEGSGWQTAAITSGTQHPGSRTTINELWTGFDLPIPAIQKGRGLN